MLAIGFYIPRQTNHPPGLPHVPEHLKEHAGDAVTCMPPHFPSHLFSQSPSSLRLCVTFAPSAFSPTHRVPGTTG